MATGTSSTDGDMVIGEAVGAAQDYIDNLGVGEQLVINEIADRLRNADSRILDVGQPNKQIPEIFIWRSRPDGTRYSRSKVEYSFISVFITSPPAILRALFWRAAWEFQNGHSGDCGNGVYQVSPSTANLSPRARERTGVLLDGCSPESPRYRGATLLQFRIGLGIVRSLGCCTGMQD